MEWRTQLLGIKAASSHSLSTYLTSSELNYSELATDTSRLEQKQSHYQWEQNVGSKIDDDDDDDVKEREPSLKIPRALMRVKREFICCCPLLLLSLLFFQDRST